MRSSFLNRKIDQDNYQTGHKCQSPALITHTAIRSLSMFGIIYFWEHHKGQAYKQSRPDPVCHTIMLTRWQFLRRTLLQISYIVVSGAHTSHACKIRWNENASAGYSNCCAKLPSNVHFSRLPPTRTGFISTRYKGLPASIPTVTTYRIPEIFPTKIGP